MHSSALIEEVEEMLLQTMTDIAELNDAESCTVDDVLQHSIQELQGLEGSPDRSDKLAHVRQVQTRLKVRTMQLQLARKRSEEEVQVLENKLFQVAQEHTEEMKVQFRLASAQQQLHSSALIEEVEEMLQQTMTEISGFNEAEADKLDDELRKALYEVRTDKSPTSSDDADKLAGVKHLQSLWKVRALQLQLARQCSEDKVRGLEKEHSQCNAPIEEVEAMLQQLLVELAGFDGAQAVELENTLLNTLCEQRKVDNGDRLAGVNGDRLAGVHQAQMKLKVLDLQERLRSSCRQDRIQQLEKELAAKQAIAEVMLRNTDAIQSQAQIDKIEGMLHETISELAALHGLDADELDDMLQQALSELSKLCERPSSAFLGESGMATAARAACTGQSDTASLHDTNPAMNDKLVGVRQVQCRFKVRALQLQLALKCSEDTICNLEQNVKETVTEGQHRQAKEQQQIVELQQQLVSNECAQLDGTAALAMLQDKLAIQAELISVQELVEIAEDEAQRLSKELVNAKMLMAMLREQLDSVHTKMGMCITEVQECAQTCAERDTKVKQLEGQVGRLTYQEMVHRTANLELQATFEQVTNQFHEQLEEKDVQLEKSWRNTAQKEVVIGTLRDNVKLLQSVSYVPTTDLSSSSSSCDYMYACDYGCGHQGNFDDVDRHEHICALSPCNSPDITRP